MKKTLRILLIYCLITSCQSKSGEPKADINDSRLIVIYSGDADVVQFKMFEGFQQVLSKDSINKTFIGNLKIPNWKDAIFSYDIIIHKKDSLGRMIELAAQPDKIKLNEKSVIQRGNRFLWVGNNRFGDYLKNEELTGSLTTKLITSELLNEDRKITIYKPKEVTQDIPHIYFTDGLVVESYAPYIDFLISNNKIKPLKLIGIHSNSSNRYEEYVQGGEDNELFKKHEMFVYNQVLKSIEKEIQDWKGKRYFYGFSNGAAFCMHAGLNHPALFDEIVAFSTADYISPFAQTMNPIEFKNDEYPKFYMGAGMYETNIFSDNIKFVKQMNDNNIEVSFKEFVSGHDYNVWRIEFLEYLEKRFGK